MVTRARRRVILVSTVLALAAATAIGQRSRYDPAAGQQSAGQQSKPRQGFLEFALKQINPNDQDYGECIGEGRQLLVGQTIQNSLFWSNLAAIGMLAISVALVVFQSKEWKRRELIAATCLAQYHNDLVRARRAVCETNSRYNALIEAQSSETEHELREPVARRESAAKDVSTRTAVQDASAASARPASAGARAQAPAKAANNPPRSAQVIENDGDLVAKVNILQHQLTVAQDQLRAAQEREQNLRQKLSQYERNGGEKRE
jgi:hypothetical protein